MYPRIPPGTVGVWHLAPFHQVAHAAVLLDQLVNVIAALAVALGAFDAHTSSLPSPKMREMRAIAQAREEVIAESKKEKDDAAADLALIGAAQRVEHYEMSGYSTARNLAQQLHHSAIVQHLSKSLAEEEMPTSSSTRSLGR